MAINSLTTVTLLHTRFPAIVSATSVSSATLMLHIQAAESKINAKLAKRYATPLPLVPVLETIATDLALQHFLKTRAFPQEKQSKSAWVDQFDDSKDLLDEIATGKTPLVNSLGAIIEQITTNLEVWSDTSGYLPTMTEDAQEAQDIDPDKIDDIRADRDDFGNL